MKNTVHSPNTLTLTNMSLKNISTFTTSGFWPGCLAPNFSANCVQSGQVFPVNLESYRGKMVLLLFYPVDFDYLSPTELLSIQNMLGELEANNCKVLAISSGSVLSKVAFLSTPKYEGGLEGVKLRLVEDMQGSIAKSYGVQRDNSGYSYRAMVLVGMDGVVVARMVMDLPIGLGMEDALRLVKATNYDKDFVEDEEKKDNNEHGEEMDILNMEEKKIHNVQLQEKMDDLKLEEKKEDNLVEKEKEEQKEDK